MLQSKPIRTASPLRRSYRIIGWILSVLMTLCLIPWPQASAKQVVYNGIDVSRWQGTIDWTTVKNSGVDFAILRAASGSSKDILFDTNIQNAKAAGVYVGAYHYGYALSVSQAVAEANQMLSYIAPYQFEFPIVYDVEDPSLIPLGKEVITDITIAYLNTIRAAGYYVMMYANLNWTRNYLNMERLAAYDLWIAQYNTTCSYTGDYGIWQYTSTGSVPGISGNVDKDYAYTDYPTIIKSLGLNNFPRPNVIDLGDHSLVLNSFDTIGGIAPEATWQTTINGVSTERVEGTGSVSATATGNRVMVYSGIGSKDITDYGNIQVWVWADRNLTGDLHFNVLNNQNYGDGWNWKRLGLSLNSGWNQITMPKSEFVAKAPEYADFANIQRMRLHIENANAQNFTILIDCAYADGVPAGVRQVEQAIDRLPTADLVRYTDQDAIVQARSLYDALRFSQKQLISNLAKLTAAESALASIDSLAYWGLTGLTSAAHDIRKTSMKTTTQSPCGRGVSTPQGGALVYGLFAPATDNQSITFVTRMKTDNFVSGIQPTTGIAHLALDLGEQTSSIVTYGEYTAAPLKTDTAKGYTYKEMTKVFSVKQKNAATQAEVRIWATLEAALSVYTISLYDTATGSLIAHYGEEIIAGASHHMGQPLLTAANDCVVTYSSLVNGLLARTTAPYSVYNAAGAHDNGGLYSLYGLGGHLGPGRYAFEFTVRTCYGADEEYARFQVARGTGTDAFGNAVGTSVASYSYTNSRAIQLFGNNQSPQKKVIRVEFDVDVTGYYQARVLNFDATDLHLYDVRLVRIYDQAFYQFQTAVAALPQPANVTASTQAAVQAALDMYNALSLGHKDRIYVEYAQLLKVKKACDNLDTVVNFGKQELLSASHDTRYTSLVTTAQSPIGRTGKRGNTGALIYGHFIPATHGKNITIISRVYATNFPENIGDDTYLGVFDLDAGEPSNSNIRYQRYKNAGTRYDETYGYTYKELVDRIVVSGNSQSTMAEARVWMTGNCDFTVYQMAFYDTATGTLIGQLDNRTVASSSAETGVYAYSGLDDSVVTYSSQVNTALSRTTSPYTVYNAANPGSQGAYVLYGLGANLTPGQYAFEFTLRTRYGMGEDFCAFDAARGTDVDATGNAVGVPLVSVPYTNSMAVQKLGHNESPRQNVVRVAFVVQENDYYQARVRSFNTTDLYLYNVRLVRVSDLTPAYLFEMAVNNLPELSAMTLEDAAAVAAVRGAYEALTESERETVTEAYTGLVAAECRIAQLTVEGAIDGIGQVTQENYTQKEAVITAVETMMENLKDQYGEAAQDGVTNRSLLITARRQYVWFYAHQYPLGDASMDGIVSIYDIIKINKYIVGSITFSDVEKLLADVDGSGTVDSADTEMIAQYITSQISEFPAEW